MADIIEQFHLRHPATDEYIAGVTLDVDPDTDEGYCVELYNDETSESTSFGKEESAACLARETYEAVCNCMTSIYDDFNNETDFWSSYDFWNAFRQHFEPGWFYYNADFDFVETTKSDADKLFTFIAEWRTKAEPIYSISCPHCGGKDISCLGTKSCELIDEEQRHYREIEAYKCHNELCQEHFEVEFIKKPISLCA